MSDVSATPRQQKSVVEACREANERYRRDLDRWDEERSVGERAVLDLGDLRAALAVTLRLLREDESGMLVGPSDREVLEEIRRLQQADPGTGARRGR
jgi:hypothetical protein